MSPKNQDHNIRLNKDQSVILTVEALSKRLNRSSRGALLRVVNNLIFKTNRLRRNDFEVLKGISFSLNKGDSLGIIGANGAGKSTLLKLLVGAFLPTEGSIQWSCKKRVYVERKLRLYNDLSLIHNLKTLAILHGIHANQQKTFIRDTLELAELSQVANSPLSKLSSGMKMRLIMASYFWLKPDVILIDEALEVGDARFRDIIREKMNSYLSQGGSAVIISHQEQLISRYCNKLLVLDKGRVLDFGETKDILAQYDFLR
tara:strand:+ start:826 stop:1602 length:777 start_codon:yes stop_codon:yes gene_type:complete